MYLYDREEKGCLVTWIINGLTPTLILLFDRYTQHLRPSLSVLSLLFSNLNS